MRAKRTGERGRGGKREKGREKEEGRPPISEPC